MNTLSKNYNHEPASSSELTPYFNLRPQATDTFRDSLRARILTQVEIKNIPSPTITLKKWFVFPSFKQLAITVTIAIVILGSLLAFKPVWSQVRERIRRFFIITTTDHTTTTSTQFWSNLSQNEMIPNLPYNVSANNSFTPQEQGHQPTTPSGFTTVAEYIIATYHLDHYSSITEILRSTPAKIIREEPYYGTGKLYVLEFPGGYLISYTELSVPISNTSSTLIRSIR